MLITADAENEQALGFRPTLGSSYNPWITAHSTAWPSIHDASAKSGGWEMTLCLHEPSSSYWNGPSGNLSGDPKGGRRGFLLILRYEESFELGCLIMKLKMCSALIQHNMSSILSAGNGSLLDKEGFA